MARRYIMTARRKAALRKAQLASARKRRKGARKAAKVQKYGASRKTATLKQQAARNERLGRRIALGYAAAYAAAGLYSYGSTYRKLNAQIAYNGQATYRGQTFTQQGGPKIFRVKPTARGARRRNRADFRKQYGSKALRQLRRNTRRTQRQQRRNVRNAVRYGSTTMTWGPRQQALPRGRR